MFYTEENSSIFKAENMDSSDFAAHLERLRKHGKDDELVEVKSWGQVPKAKGAQSLWQSVSAFANTNGGNIILGLSEPGFLPVEGFDTEKAAQKIRSGFNDQDHDAQKIQPAPAHSIQVFPVGNSEVVVIGIEPLEVNGPCFLTGVGLKNGSFKRVGDEDRRLNQFEVYELQHRFDKIYTDRNPVPDSTKSDLDPGLISAVHQRLTSTGSRVIKDGMSDEWLRLKNITTGNDQLTLAGLLTMGTFPQQYFPRLFIDVAVHPGNQKSPVGTKIRFEDRQICEGNLLEMVRSALQAIRRNLRTRRVIEGHSGQDVLEIPEEVLREALANAVMHRDYSAFSHNESIGVDIYKDRVEISSPGGLPGGKTPDTITDGHSVPRNQTLSRILMDVPWPDEIGGVLAESNGSGIPRMFNLMREAGLPIPDFDIDISRVTVKLSRHGLLDPETSQWLENRLGDNFSAAQGIALVLAKEMGSVSPRDLRRQTGHDSEDMRTLLQGLTNQGALLEVLPDKFQLGSPSGNLTESEFEILTVISATTPTTIREISEETGRTINSIRPILRSLVDAGLVNPTAPPSSRNRAYLRP